MINEVNEIGLYLKQAAETNSMNFEAVLKKGRWHYKIWEKDGREPQDTEDD